MFLSLQTSSRLRSRARSFDSSYLTISGGEVNIEFLANVLQVPGKFKESSTSNYIHKHGKDTEVINLEYTEQ